MVKQSLLEGPKSVYDLWKDILKKLEGTPYAKPSYGSLRIMVYCLKRLGLVKVVGTQPSSRRGYYPRHLYAIVKARAESEAWLSPYEAYYRPREFKARVHLKNL